MKATCLAISIKIKCVCVRGEGGGRGAGGGRVRVRTCACVSTKEFHLCEDLYQRSKRIPGYMDMTFIAVKIWRQKSCFCGNDWQNHCVSIYTMKYYTVLKRMNWNTARRLRGIHIEFLNEKDKIRKKCA